MPRACWLALGSKIRKALEVSGVEPWSDLFSGFLQSDFEADSGSPKCRAGVVLSYQV